MSKQNNKKFSVWRFLPFVTGVNNTGGAPWAANISANFRKNSKRPYWYTLGLGGNWFMKKTEVENSWHCPFKLWTLNFSRPLIQYVCMILICQPAEFMKRRFCPYDQFLILRMCRVVLTAFHWSKCYKKLIIKLQRAFTVRVHLGPSCSQGKEKNNSNSVVYNWQLQFLGSESNIPIFLPPIPNTSQNSMLCHLKILPSEMDLAKIRLLIR